MAQIAKRRLLVRLLRNLRVVVVMMFVRWRVLRFRMVFMMFVGFVGCKV